MDTLPRWRWRSLLFVPADNARILEKAHTRGADALIIDLEDAVAETAKPAARAKLAANIAFAQKHGATVLVRVNSDERAMREDLQAGFRPGIAGIVLPKVERPAQIDAALREILHLERTRGLKPGTTGVIAMIESPAALLNANAIAAAQGVIALAFGTEDFSLALGTQATPAALKVPCQMLGLAAAAHGRMAFGLPTSIADYRDLEALKAAARHARSFGMTGAMCIHPAQVKVINESFAATDDEIRWAEAVVAAWQEAVISGSAIAAHDGKMIDRPVIERAQALLERRKAGR